MMVGPYTSIVINGEDRGCGVIAASHGETVYPGSIVEMDLHFDGGQVKETWHVLLQNTSIRGGGSIFEMEYAKLKYREAPAQEIGALDWKPALGTWGISPQRALVPDEAAGDEIEFIAPTLYRYDGSKEAWQQVTLGDLGGEIMLALLKQRGWKVETNEWMLDWEWTAPDGRTFTAYGSKDAPSIANPDLLMAIREEFGVK